MAFFNLESSLKIQSPFLSRGTILLLLHVEFTWSWVTQEIFAPNLTQIWLDTFISIVFKTNQTNVL